MTQYKVDLPGEDLGIFDDESITIQQAFAIKAASGLSIKPFFDGLNNIDPLSAQTLVWFQRLQAGTSVPLQEIDFRMIDLTMAPIVPPSQPVVTEATSAGSETTPSAS